MDATASYAARRGFPLLIVPHYLWMRRYLNAHFSANPESASVTVVLPGVFGLWSPRVQLGPVGALAGTKTRLGLLVALQVIGGAYETFRTLLGDMARNAARSAQTFAKQNLAATPALIATIIIVFLTADAWKILGQGFDWQFLALLGFFLLLGAIVASDYRHRRRYLATPRKDFRRLVSETPAKPPAERLERLPTPPGSVILSRPFHVNVSLVYVGMITVNLVVVAVLVALALTVVGVVRIDAEKTKQLTGESAHVLIGIGDQVLTAELVSLSLTLGGLAALSFTVSTLASTKARADFIRKVTVGLRRVVVAYATYVAAMEREEELTGVSSRRA
jgi:hypothetical protein